MNKRVYPAITVLFSTISVQSYFFSSSYPVNTVQKRQNLTFTPKILIFNSHVILYFSY